MSDYKKTWAAVGKCAAAIIMTFAGSSAFALPSINSAPRFVAGPQQSFALCGNAGPRAINSEIAIVDSDAGQTETWTVTMAPVHGALSGFPVSASSTGGVVTPSWLDYTPVTGYAGLDSFSISVTDGAATATTTFTITVNPSPVFTSPLLAAVCDGAVFSYIPSSSTPGVVFAWHRAFAPGISNPTASGAGSPGETLYNITNDDAMATYVYTLAANGCITTANVAVTVHPTPRLSGSTNDSVCSGETFTFSPSSPTAGVSFAWSRAVVSGIEPATPASGTGAISETLTNTTVGPLSVVYAFVLTANGCTANRNLTVTVFPAVAATAITTASPAALCSGTQFQNFGAAAVPAPGTTYTWSADNALVTAVGATGQYCLVSFPNPGDAVVRLTAGGGTPCAAASTYTVTVGTDVSATSTVIYYNYIFALQDNTPDTYQWGYDNKETLDSTLIPGATFQSYANATPDFANNYYWVISTKNGCLQKTYFNSPVRATTPAVSGAHVRLVPNPAASMVKVVFPGATATQHELIVTDMLGRQVGAGAGNGNEISLDVAGLAEGSYLVECFDGAVKTATLRFVKNRQ